MTPEKACKLPRPRLRSDAERVLQVLSDFCDSLHPGDTVPTYYELMRRFNASERAVRGALDELHREGKIVRRQGARTYIADKKAENRVQTGHELPEPIKAHLNGKETTHWNVSPEETRTVVAVAVPDHALFDQAMRLLGEQAKIRDLSLMCHILPDAVTNVGQLPQIAHEPLGFLLFRRELLPLAEQLYAVGHRVVLVGTPFTEVNPAVPVIYGDQEHGGYLATKHLIDLGHRRLAFCAFADYQKTLRWRGHESAVREASKQGIEVQTSVLDLEVMRTWKENPALGKAVFHRPDAPTGLIVWNDHEAALIMGGLTRLGLRVPQDISIVGYDNLREGQFLYPSLTTVHSPIEQQLQAALNLLVRPQLPSVPYQVIVVPTLICRDSSAKIAC